MQMSEKLAHCVNPHAAFEAEGIERRDHQAGQPTAALFCCPQPGLRMDIPVLQSLPQTMHAALGESGFNCALSNACPGVVAKKVENQTAFRPKSHVGRSSAG